MGVIMKVLILSAHADDGEMASGGYINRFISEGNEVYYAAFSIAEESVPEGFDRDIVEKECRESTKKLGIPEDNVFIHKFPVRRFWSQRQDILDILIGLRKDITPDICITPSTTDIHQDHKVVNNESIRAFHRSSSIYGYDFPWNVLYTPKLNLFVELSEENLKRKIDAAQSYRSQLVKDNNCFTEEYIRSIAVVRGNMIRVKYAEAFETIREIRKV